MVTLLPLALLGSYHVLNGCSQQMQLQLQLGSKHLQTRLATPALATLIFALALGDALLQLKWRQRQAQRSQQQAPPHGQQAQLWRLMLELLVIYVTLEATLMKLRCSLETAGAVLCKWHLMPFDIDIHPTAECELWGLAEIMLERTKLVYLLQRYLGRLQAHFRAYVWLLLETIPQLGQLAHLAQLGLLRRGR